MAATHRFAAEVKAGSVWIGRLGAARLRLPWGGVKTSGVGCELGWAGIEAHTTEKTVTMTLWDAQSTEEEAVRVVGPDRLQPRGRAGSEHLLRRAAAFREVLVDERPTTRAPSSLRAEQLALGDRVGLAAHRDAPGEEDVLARQVRQRRGARPARAPPE